MYNLLHGGCYQGQYRFVPNLKEPVYHGHGVVMSVQLPVSVCVQVLARAPKAVSAEVVRGLLDEENTGGIFQCPLVCRLAAH